MPRPRPYNLKDRETLRSLESLESADAEHHTPQAALVCIHGILSAHKECFDDMFRLLAADSRFNSWELCWYDYDYHSPMQENGLALANVLRKQFRPQDSVVLVCHSMGGLVARFAILSLLMPFVKRVIMLGSPNSGAFRTHRLGVLAQLLLKTTHKTYGLFSRKQGILDLTRVPELVKAFIDDERGRYSNADHVEYVTIPGLYFDVDRSSWRMQREGWTMAFTGMDLQLAVASGFPLFDCHLERPHDGIVEATSNCMIPMGVEVPDTEKTVPILDRGHYPQSGYAHVVHRRACKDCTHVEIQHDERIIKLVAEIVLAESLAKWDANRDASHEIVVRLR